MISDMSDESKVYGVMDTGIEQRALSVHKTDFMDLFHSDQYVVMPTNRHLKDAKTLVTIRK